jgi:hypothetical protein
MDSNRAVCSTTVCRTKDTQPSLEKTSVRRLHPLAAGSKMPTEGPTLALQ